MLFQQTVRTHTHVYTRIYVYFQRFVVMAKTDRLGYKPETQGLTTKSIMIDEKSIKYLNYVIEYP